MNFLKKKLQIFFRVLLPCRLFVARGVVCRWGRQQGWGPFGKSNAMASTTPPAPPPPFPWPPDTDITAFLDSLKLGFGARHSDLFIRGGLSRQSLLALAPTEYSPLYATLTALDGMPPGLWASIEQHLKDRLVHLDHIKRLREAIGEAAAAESPLAHAAAAGRAGTNTNDSDTSAKRWRGFHVPRPATHEQLVSLLLASSVPSESGAAALLLQQNLTGRDDAVLKNKVLFRLPPNTVARVGDMMTPDDRTGLRTRIVLTGLRGSGKTYLLRQLCRDQRVVEAFAGGAGSGAGAGAGVGAGVDGAGVGGAGAGAGVGSASGATAAAAAAGMATPRYNNICFVSVGLKPTLRSLYEDLYRQLKRGRRMSRSVLLDGEAFHELKTCALGRQILLVLDDVTAISQLEALDFLDLSTFSCLVVGARTKEVAAEMEKAYKECQKVKLEPLTDREAASMLSLASGQNDPALWEQDGLSVGRPANVLKAAGLCAALPLNLMIAGALLEDQGGYCDEDFMLILMDSMRQTDLDTFVRLEHRLVAASLGHYSMKRSGGIGLLLDQFDFVTTGASAEQVRGLFKTLAVFPEHASVPQDVFRAIAPALEEHFEGTRSSTREASIAKIDGWVNALRSLALLTTLQDDGHDGDGGDGRDDSDGLMLSIHPIIRAAAIAMHSADELRTLQQWFILVVMGARDERCSNRSPPRTVADLRLVLEFGNPMPIQVNRAFSLSARRYLQVHLGHHIRGAVDDSIKVEAAKALAFEMNSQRYTQRRDHELVESRPLVNAKALALAQEAAKAAEAEFPNDPFFKRLIFDADPTIMEAVVVAIGVEPAAEHALGLFSRCTTEEASLGIHWCSAVAPVVRGLTIVSETEYLELAFERFVAPDEVAALPPTTQLIVVRAAARLSSIRPRDEALQDRIRRRIKDVAVQGSAKWVGLLTHVFDVATMRIIAIHLAISSLRNGSTKTDADWCDALADFVETTAVPRDLARQLRRDGAQQLTLDVLALAAVHSLVFFLPHQAASGTELDAESFFATEDELERLVEVYSLDHYAYAKRSGELADHFIMGDVLLLLGLRYANLDAAEACMTKMHATWKHVAGEEARDLRTGWESDAESLLFALGANSAPYLCYLLGRPDLGLAFLRDALGAHSWFQAWEDAFMIGPSRNRVDDLARIITRLDDDGSMEEAKPFKQVLLLVRMAEFLCMAGSPEEGSAASTKRAAQDLKDGGLPSPKHLQRLDHFGLVFGTGIATCLTLGGRCHEALGNWRAAADCARRAIEFHRKPVANIDALLLLGRYETREEHRALAVTHFQNAASAAFGAGFPILALIAGRECGGKEGEEIILDALSEMPLGCGRDCREFFADQLDIPPPYVEQKKQKPEEEEEDEDEDEKLLKRLLAAAAGSGAMAARELSPVKGRGGDGDGNGNGRGEGEGKGDQGEDEMVPLWMRGGGE